MGRFSEMNVRQRVATGVVAALVAAAVAFCLAAESGLCPAAYALIGRDTPNAITVATANGSTSWGETLHARVSGLGFFPFSSTGYQWYRSADGGQTWEPQGEESTEEMGPETTRADAGTLWRCVVTRRGFAGGTLWQVESEAYGPLANQAWELEGRILGTNEVGCELTLQVSAPEGCELTYQWRRAVGRLGEAADIPGATGSSYTTTAEDEGCWITCEVSGTAAGYDVTGASLSGYDLIRAGGTSGDGAGASGDGAGASGDGAGTGTAASSGAGSAGTAAGSSAASSTAVYVCNSAGNAYYHRLYDCDELSHLREQGFATTELTLAEAQKSYSPCPYCAS